MSTSGLGANAQPYLVLLLGLLGLIFGSFSSALVARVPNGQSLLSRSRCPYCSHVLTATENVPLVTFIIQKGLCKNCSAKISWLYPVQEILSGILFLTPLIFTSIWLHSWQHVVIWELLVIFGVPLAIIDLKLHRLPDILTGSLFLLVASVELIHAVAYQDYARLFPSLLGATLFSAFYLAIMIISRGGMGMGDVKLSASLGLISGYCGLHTALISCFAAFGLGSVVGIVLMVFGKAGSKTAIPFGPFMIVGQALSLLYFYSHFL